MPLTSIYPLEHDTIDVAFKTRDMEYYGQILLTLENVNNQVLVQLISKDKVIRELPVAVDGAYTFSYLIPQEYNIKVYTRPERKREMGYGKIHGETATRTGRTAACLRLL